MPFCFSFRSFSLFVVAIGAAEIKLARKPLRNKYDDEQTFQLYSHLLMPCWLTHHDVPFKSAWAFREAPTAQDGKPCSWRRVCSARENLPGNTVCSAYIRTHPLWKHCCSLCVCALLCLRVLVLVLVLKLKRSCAFCFCFA